MAVSLTVALFAEGYPILPHVTMDSFFHSTHPQGLGIWPGLFIVIACGAISGFHATQSPMMARCMTNEAQGRKVFYGSMICEGIVGLVWVTLGLSFYDSAQALFGPGPNAVPAAVIVKTSPCPCSEPSAAFLLSLASWPCPSPLVTPLSAAAA